MLSACLAKLYVLNTRQYFVCDNIEERNFVCSSIFLLTGEALFKQFVTDFIRF